MVTDMRKLVYFTAISGLSSVFNMLLVVARAKILAMFLGPSGVGLVAQINTFDTLISTLASVGIGYGITNLVSRSQGCKGNPINEANTIQTGGYLLLLIYTPVLLAIGICSSSLANVLLGNKALAPLFLLVSFGLLYKIFSFFIESIMQGHKAIRGIAQARATGAALGFVAVIPLAWSLGVTGAVMGIAMWYIFLCAAFMFFCYRSGINWFALWSKGRFSLHQARIIINFGFMMFLSNSINALVLLLIRTQVVRYIGPDANGIYQVVWAVSSQFLILVPLSLWSYAYPRLSEIISDERLLRSELDQVLRLGLLLIVPLITIVVSTRSVLVKVLYTAEFLAATELILVQVWGDLLRLITWWLELPLYASGNILKVFMIEVSWNSVYLLIGSVLLRNAGLQGLCVSYIIAGLMSIVVALWIHRKHWYVSLSGSNLSMFVKGALLVAVSSMIPQKNTPLIIAAALAMGAFWALWVLSKEEWLYIREFLRRHGEKTS